MMRTIFFFFLFITAFSLTINAQNYFFSEARESELKSDFPGKRLIIPDKFRTVALDRTGIQGFLKSAPAEFSIVSLNEAPIIDLPMPDGSKSRFRVVESPIMEPGLASQFPNIKTYLGQGIDDPSAIARLDYTELGFHAMILSPESGNIYIDPYRQFDQTNYLVYDRKDLRPTNSFLEYDLIYGSDESGKPNGNRPMGGPCIGTQLKTYRLAIACTGEYARAVAGSNPTVAQTLSAIVTSINRVTGIYERDLAIRLSLVSNNSEIVFVDPATDPFTANNDGSSLLDESQTVINSRIGSPNYDIGHTFSTGAGGIAQVGSACGSSKARGVTGLPNPTGDAYDVDYVAHEMGHQFGASHSFNATSSSCGGNRNASTAVEPGSGITIMSYAGICGAGNNLGSNSLPYFHGVSVDEILAYTLSGTGSTCGSFSSTGNIIPVINAGNDFIIPRSTPFVLTGSGSDANGDAISYSWEQIDTGPSGDWNNPSGNAPIFRSFVPVSTPQRFFPKLSDQINNTTTIGELLPSYGRTMNFRLTGRDNRAGGGGVCYDETSIIVNGSSGPFVVNVPSASGITWSGGTNRTVTWNVANTNGSPVNCSNVTIQLSTDGGLTFPTTILASTPNDGSEQIVVPNIVTSQARIRVMAVGNIFYDMSDNNFSIVVPQQGFEFTTPDAAKVPCAGTSSTSITLGVISVLGYSNPVTLSATGNPPGTTVTFSATTVNPGSNVQVSLNNTDLLPFDSSYVITVTGVSGNLVRTQNLTYTIQTGTGPSIQVQPVPIEVCNLSSAGFSVSSSDPAKGYQWQFSTNGGASYNNIPGATASSYTIPVAEKVQHGYLYRALVRGQCNITPSNAVELTVFNLPEVELTTDNLEIIPGETSELNLSVIPGSGLPVKSDWFKDGVKISVSGNSLLVPVTGLGEYYVEVTDDNGCVNSSDIVAIEGRSASQLFIFPSPNNGKFKLSYFNPGSGNSRQTVIIYDAKGARVYSKTFVFTGSYELHDIDLSGMARGLYFVVIGDADGKKLGQGKVLIQ